MTTMKMPHDLSTFEREVFEHLDQHVESEREVIDLYDDLANDAHPYVAFIAQLIREDEIRHHRLFNEWIGSIKAQAELGEAPIPALDRHPVGASTMNGVERLLEFEKEDLEASKHLRKSLREVRNATLWSALVDMMIADTKKHIELLSFVHDRLVEVSRST